MSGCVSPCHLLLTWRLHAANLAVSCPICSGSFKNSELNRHLDRCNGMPPIASKSAGESKSAWGDLMKIGSKSSQKNKEKAKDSE